MGLRRFMADGDDLPQFPFRQVEFDEAAIQTDSNCWECQHSGLI
jgi:hypothetical protein